MTNKKLIAFQKKHNIAVGKVKVIKPWFERVHSWSYMLDLLWAWWLPKWRLCQFWGKPQHWKTSMAYVCIAEALKRWDSVLLVDKEYSRDPFHAKSLWIDIDWDMDITQPDNWDQAFDLVTYVLNEWIYDLIVVDSIASCKPARHLEGSAADANVWISAKATATAAEMRAPIARKTWTTILGINQFRSWIWPFAKDYYPWWWNWEHNLMQSARFNSPKMVWDEDGIELSMKRDKLKWARVIKEANIEILFNWWVNKKRDVVDACIAIWIVEQNASMYNIEWGEKVKWKKALYTDEVVSKLEPKLKEAMERLRTTWSPFNES